MKATSSKNESKKRKRDDSQEQLSENPKKAKVHAQRKFAQGAAFNSPVITPIKDKVRPSGAVSSSGPILTGKCPNTEDFLTFLCFRRTSILPSKLDFFKDAFGSEPEPSPSAEKTNHKCSSEQTGKQVTKKSDKNEDSKKSQIPAVQALRRKYQEQRLAKQKATNVTRLAQKVKGKNMVRTRSSAVVEETKTAAKKNPEKESKNTASGLRSGLKRMQGTVGKAAKKAAKPKYLRSGLRSGGSVAVAPAKGAQETKPSPVVKKTEKEGRKAKADVAETKTKVNRTKKAEGFSDFSSDDNEPLLAVRKPKTGGKSTGKADGGKTDWKTAVKTRSKVTETVSSKALLRPTRKTKEAAALYMEMITKKLVSPDKSGDEDMSSVESFPELPNAKRTEQRETEIKTKALAPRRPDPKQEEKVKESKKTTPKKSNQSKKAEPKNIRNETGKKASLKKEAKGERGNLKEEIPSVKRSGRGLAKDESIKTKQAEEQKSEQIRPSTRSRHHEIAVPLKKASRKGIVKKAVKVGQQKETEKRASEEGKKLKGNKDVKPISPKKVKSEVSDLGKKSHKDSSHESSGKSSDAREKTGKAEQSKMTRKVSDKKPKEKKDIKEIKEKKEIKEIKEIKEKDKPAVKKRRKSEKANEVEVDAKKHKAGEKKSEKKAKKDEERRDDVGVSKRPTRKCSTADRIWIDIDGFTSDEDDFLEVSPITKTRASTKKDNSSNEKPKEKKPNKPEEAVPSKNKTEKVNERKADDKKPEAKKGKSEKKPAEGHNKMTTQTDGKKGVTKAAQAEEGGKRNEQKESAGEGGKKTEVKPGEVKKSERALEEGGGETVAEHADIGGKKKEDDKGKKKEEKKEARKGYMKKPRNLRRSGNEEEEQSGNGKRTRPVRQCSTGEKRWIETDSDSFSFYETSDDEDNLPIVDFSKKSSPDTKDRKTPPDVSKGSEEKKQEDNFSESDEEPLRKKAHVEEMSKKEPEAKTSGKTQREVPGLTPLKKPPTETQTNIPAGPKPAKPEPELLPVVIPAEPKPLFCGATVPDTRPQSLPQAKQVEVPSFLPEASSVSVPNRIEMILHSLKRDKMVECGPSHANDVKVTFAKVPYQAQTSQMSQVPCTYQVKATFPTPREPISTHGLDLLSEVALPTTPKENSQTKRIEKWLSDSLVAEQKPRLGSYDSAEYKPGAAVEKPEAGFFFGKTVATPPKVGFSSHSEFQKFGQLELLESQKLLKKNLLAAEMKQDAGRVDQQQQQQQLQSTPKKALTSVQDLLKLQKERREVSKAADNAPHLKNCKCNNCVVKKGWFKNKPVPKTEQQKSSPVEEPEESPKPFESLTKAFIGEGKNSKMAVSVAPMVVVSPPQTPSSSKDSCEKKSAFQQRKLSFLERMKERERKEAAAAAAKPSPNPFSPNNESSVYAFEPEPEHSVGTNTPFRSKTRESKTSSTSASRSDDEGLKVSEDESPRVASNSQKLTPEKGPKAAFQSASIAVQVNLDSETVAEVEPLPDLQDGKSIEISTQTEVPEEDSDSPMFYIPLQQATTAGASASSDQQLIQGVALKLGTEGPMGPNQRVIMKAKLVTKPPDSPSIKAVVMPQPKRLFDQKYSNPPIGTVQPTTRKPPDESVGDKSDSAKPVIPAVKDSPEQIPQSADADVSKGGKTPPTPKSLKSKEKVVRQEGPEEQGGCSSASSSKAKRPTKQKSSEPVISPSNSTWLPPAGTPSKLVEAPTFHPTEKDFQDPFEFFDRIRPAAEKFGLCRIVPPSNFKPDCKVSDDMRFTAYNQYVHRMFHRWGPNIKEMMAIKKYLATQSISLKQPPWIGGIEVDLPRLYQSVQNCGGLMKVMEKKKWHQVADMMKIPKAAQDRVTKLDDIYCKYLLPYDTLSHDERQKLFDDVESDWAERQKSPPESQDSQEEDESEENYIEECEECVVKGRNMALNQFYRIARNTMSMWFRNAEPSPREVESEFWRHVSERNHHVCVHSGSIDSSGWGYGFPIAKNNSFSKHPWNLKVLTNNSGSVLRYLGPVMGVTVPTLHVGMVFTAFCWYRDPHGLPWIEYLHTGAPKIWYGISDDNSTVFQEALTKLLPRYIKNKTIWLPSDTAMIPPELLVEHGVSLCHTVQEPGQFILVFPRAFTSSICTGYLVSESVYFAQLTWLATAEQVFKDIQESCEPSMFSLEKLLFSIATDSRSSGEVLKQVLPMVWHVRQKEVDGRKTLFNLGLKSSERLPAREAGGRKKKGRWTQEEDGDYECEICRTNLYVSLVTNSQEEGVYCLPHAIELLTQKRHQLKYCKLMYIYTQEEMNEMVEKLEQRIESKCQKKQQSKPSTSAK